MLGRQVRYWAHRPVSKGLRFSHGTLWYLTGLLVATRRDLEA